MPRTREKKEEKVPTELPPEMKELAATAVKAQEGPAMSIDEVIGLQGKLLEEAAPTLSPPAEPVEAGAGEEAITAWHSGVKVTALWVNASQRNAWAAVQGLGWRRITPANDSAFHAITAMLSHAKQMNVSCNVRVESDNLIHEAYVW